MDKVRKVPKSQQPETNTKYAYAIKGSQWIRRQKSLKANNLKPIQNMHIQSKDLNG